MREIKDGELLVLHDGFLGRIPGRKRRRGPSTCYLTHGSGTHAALLFSLFASQTVQVFKVCVFWASKSIFIHIGNSVLVIMNQS